MDFSSLKQGLLPKWVLTTAIVSLGNSVQAYSTLQFTKGVYENATITPLSARTFGTWTFFAAIVRIFAALNINDPILYKLAFAAYGTAFLHFFSEWLVFGTTKWGKGLAGPIFVSTGSMIWMLMQWDYYVR